MTVIQPATREHVERLLSIGLRAADVREIEAVGFTAADGVRRSFDASTRAWTLLNGDGEPVALLGVTPWPGEPNVGVPWLVATDTIRKHAVTLQRRTREYLERMGFPVLSNYVSVERHDVMCWLKDAGFRLDTAETLLGPNRVPFIQFGMRV